MHLDPHPSPRRGMFLRLLVSDLVCCEFLQGPGTVPLIKKKHVVVWANDGDAVFIREFTLIRRDHLAEEPLHDGGQKPEDPGRLVGNETDLPNTLYPIPQEGHR
ncbi:hypothetical protein EYF80_005793 [Liparis tanakae]|uniref:Uncharacterized protein n=1 Tax=Liparis tanakae TaxID=230148 RepID=A0A4Z2J352_9TELE|nr:hypothetical protein EYF80_005793 [Liparis tanakae]